MQRYQTVEIDSLCLNSLLRSAQLMTKKLEKAARVCIYSGDPACRRHHDRFDWKQSQLYN